MEKRHANGHSQSNYNTSSGRGRSQIPRSLYIAPFLSLSLFPCFPPPLSTFSHGSLLRLFTSSFCLLARHPHFIPWYHIWATHLLSAKAHLPHQIISWLPAAEISRPLRDHLQYATLLCPVLYFSTTSSQPFHRCRNNRFAHLAVTILTRPASRDTVLGLMKGDCPPRHPPVAIVLLFHPLPPITLPRRKTQ